MNHKGWQVGGWCIPALTALIVQFPSDLTSSAWNQLLQEPAKLNAAMVCLYLAYAFKKCGCDLLLTASLSLCPWLIDAPTLSQIGIVGAWMFCALQLTICRKYAWAFLPVPLYSLDLILQCYKPFFGLQLGPFHLSPLSLLQVDELGVADGVWAMLTCGLMWGVGYGLERLKQKTQ